MPVNFPTILAQDLHPVAGVTLHTAQAGIKKPNRKDVLVMTLSAHARVAGVFTQNRFCAAPVQLCREHLALPQASIRALVINTGCANAGTGARGLADARATCVELAKTLDVQPTQILPFSTGVILEPLPMDRLKAGLHQLQPAHWLEAAQAIMTTDTLPKAASRQIQLGARTITLTGIAKGAGMIRPNMATMLGFIATDAKVSQSALTSITRHAADHSFNRITVDGDTSTNDSFVIAATGMVEGDEIDERSADYAMLRDALTDVARTLAHLIVRDAEGATKFISVLVEGGKTEEECARVAYAIGHSPLVKTAFFASDPNLGRILCAVGYAGIGDLESSAINLWLDDVWVAKEGGRNPDYREEEGQRVMRQAEILVRVHLGRGTASTTVWTCDLSHDYVTINADYRS